MQAFRTVWNESKIQEVQSRLQSIRDELQFRILVSIKEDNIHGLDEASRKVLEEIINSNRTLKADIRTQTHNILTEQKVEGARAADRHKEVLDAIFTQNLKAPSVDTILQTLHSKLYYHRQDDRFEDIAQAHQQTFTWALEKKNPSQSEPDLLNWLQSLSGTYWISGKAGSGKSTLMKYLVQDPRFEQALQEWAGDDNLVIATFYFWRAGAPLQRTQTGLLQSLLWQVLDQQPTMGSLLFPEQYVYGAVWTEFPTFHQLRRAFNRFANHITSSSVIPIKVAFIVDGLDEFEQDVIDFTGLADIFLTSSRSSNVKALVSSRPLPAFESSFEGVPKLHLHELTHSDVAAYVEAELGTRLRSTNSSTHGSNSNADLLLAEIVDAAAGVFLWVKLVVRSLVEGVRNRDTVDILRTRLQALPRDLEDLFDFMLGSVPDLYKKESSQIFQLFRKDSQIRGIAYFTATNLLFALNWNEASVLQAPIATMALAERGQAERDIDLRLKSRCVGLLELRTRIIKSAERKNGTIPEEETHRDIVYLHRTVAEYLSRPDVWVKISSWTAGINFDAAQLLLQSTIMEMKVIKPPLPEADAAGGATSHKMLWCMVNDAMKFARDAESTADVPISALLHELDRVAAIQFTRATKSQTPLDHTWYVWYMSILIGRDTVWQSVLPTHDNFLSLMVYHGLHHSVADVLSTHPQAVLSKKGRPLLHYTCLGVRSDYRQEIDPHTMQLLLEGGADPNRDFDGRSAYRNTLELYTNRFEGFMITLGSNPFILVSALMMLVKHGARPNTRIDFESTYQQDSDMQRVEACLNSFLQGRLDGVASRIIQSYLRYREADWPPSMDFHAVTRRMLPEHKEELRQAREMGLDLIKLLKSKGAKAQVWTRRDERWVKVGGFRDRTSAFFTGRDWRDRTSAFFTGRDWKEETKPEPLLYPGNFWTLL